VLIGWRSRLHGTMHKASWSLPWRSRPVDSTSDDIAVRSVLRPMEVQVEGGKNDEVMWW
jgi:hypothetical protein